MQQFKSGDEVYTASGIKCRFVQEVEGSCLVIPFMDEEGAYFGDPFYVRNIFSAPPKEEKHAEIVALDAEIQAKRLEVRSLREELASAQKERDGMLARLKEHEALKRIDDYLAGKFAYFVVIDYDAPRIVAAEKALEEIDNWGGRSVSKGTKLLTLFGTDRDRFRNGRGLQWEISKYSDGSGHSTEVYPVESEALGKEMIQRIYDTKVEDWRNNGGKHYHEALTWAKCEHLVVPEDVKEFLKQKRIKAAADAVEEARQKLQKETLALEKAQACEIL